MFNNYVMKFTGAVVAILVATISLVLGVNNYCRAKACLDWPSVEGKITVSELVYGIADDSADLEFEYEYEVDGESYVSDKVDFGEPFATGLSEHVYIRQVQKYKKDSGVTVYYDPEDPSMAVLERDVEAGILYYIIAGALIFFAAYLFKDGHNDLEFEREQNRAEDDEEEEWY